ncbi:MAG: hypothetical protein ACR2MT_03680 [Aurantibacter sp.]
MKKEELLAAEVYGYSYQHYQEKLEMGHPRFKKLMPEKISILEKAEKENWEEEKLSKALDIPSEHLPGLLDNFRQAIDIVDSSNSAESFRKSLKHSIKNALSEGLNSEKEIEALATQICYRTADLGYLIDQKGKKLTDYSEDLRWEPDIEHP